MWDRAPQVLTGGVLHAGKFERYLAAFRDRVLPRVQSRDVIRAMAGSTDPAAQRELFDRRWNSWRWRLLFRLFFSRAVMERRGRQREFFEHVEGRVADRFLARAEWALTAIPVATNPYLVWILDGTERAPAYLREPEAQRIRERLDRLVIVQDDLTGHLAGARGAYHAHNYHAHNLSDCAEYLPPDAADALLRAVVAASQPGARVCYWNLLVPRDGARVPGLASEEALAAALHARDRAFFYSRLVVERVTG